MQRRKTIDQVRAILTEAGLDMDTLRTIRPSHPDFDPSMEIIQELVNQKKLYVSDLQMVSSSKIWPIKPVPKKKKAEGVTSTEGNPVIAPADAPSRIMAMLLKERDEAMYNELKNQVVDYLLQQERQRMMESIAL